MKKIMIAALALVAASGAFAQAASGSGLIKGAAAGEAKSLTGAGATILAKIGIDKATAEKVMTFLHDHKDEALEMLTKSGLKDKLPGGLGDKLGGLF